MESLKSSLVLLSAGLDSTVNLYEAKQSSNVQRALTFDYGQRAARREIEFARIICEKLDVPHQVIDLPWLSEITQTSLVSRKVDVPVKVDLLSDEGTIESAKQVWVPNRNGVFLNAAAAVAEGLGIDWVVPGFNLEEAQTFPDNSKAYVNALNQSFSRGTDLSESTIRGPFTHGSVVVSFRSGIHVDSSRLSAVLQKSHRD